MTAGVNLVASAEPIVVGATTDEEGLIEAG